MMDTLPNEIVLLILVELDKKDVFSFLQTCRTFLDFIRDELFWRDFIYRKYQVKYCDPTLSWWQLFSSGDASTMCCHINVALTHPITLETKKSMVWSTTIGDNGICMEPQCQFMGCDDTYFKPGQLSQHYQDTGHPIVLKLSLLNYMELWCYACHRPIGICITPQTSSEKYLCSTLLKEITTHNERDMMMLEKKRWIEQTITTTYQYNYTFLVEKQWFTTWIQFLIGKSNNVPTSLDNSILFHEDKLRTDLIIGVDYELVGSSIKLYIERIYGLTNKSKIMSTHEVKDEPKYRSILHSIHLNRQFY